MSYSIRISIFFFIGFLLGKDIYAQYSTEKINQIVAVLEKVHVEPIGINDTLSNRVYKQFLNILDPGEFIFLASDIRSFEIYKDSIDEQIHSGKFPFITLVGNTYIKRLAQTDSLVRVILKSEINFMETDSVTFNSKNPHKFATSLTSLSKRWEKWLKYKTLIHLYASHPKLLNSSEDSIQLALKSSLEKMKIEINCIIDTYSIDNQESIKKSILDDFLSAIAISYDPHSSFFTEEAKASFDYSLSVESLDFGIYLEKEEGVIKIKNMAPGGPAWKSNQINKGDVITKIMYNDSLEVNLSCLDAYEIEEILFSNVIKSIVITLVKKSGQTQVVSLTKAKIETEENIMTAIVLAGEKRIGYLPIPSFYSDSESEITKGCANDVAKEILKMKKDSIEGLILDLRFNGGGSLTEAIDFAGIFIDVGPIGSISSAPGKPKLMKDMNRGTAYRGPLIIIINGASASASEVLSGALQLHNRAIIVGSTSYGKSTGQMVVPIDTNYWNNNGGQPEDFVKVTTIKLHNVKNGSHQKIGIKPDIVLPDIWKSFIPSEKDESYALENDSIVKKVYLKPYPKLPIAALRKKNQKRIASNKIFQYIISANDSLNMNRKIESRIALTLQDYWKYASIREDNYNFLEKSIINEELNFTPKNLTYYKEIDDLNQHFHDKSERLFKTLKQDATLNETYNIMIDLIKINEQ